MNGYFWTYEDVHDKDNNVNNDNSLNFRNVVGNTINKFKSKLLDIITPKNTKPMKRYNIGTLNNSKSTEQKNTANLNNSKTNRKLFLSNDERKILFDKSIINLWLINNFEKELKWEKNLLSHFELIKRFIPWWAEKVINNLNKRIREIEDKLIELRLENIRINSKLDPFEKDNIDWKENIFNSENRVPFVEQSLEEKINVNIIRLKSNLDLEKWVLNYYENLAGNNEEDIKNVHLNIKILEDHLIALELQKVRINTKSNPYKKDKVNSGKIGYNIWYVTDWNENIFNNKNRVPFVERSLEEKININIIRLEAELDSEKKLLNYYEKFDSKNEKGIKDVHISIKEIEDQLIELKIQKIKIGNKKN